MSRLVTLGEVLLRLSPMRDSDRFFDDAHFATWFGGSELNVAVAYARLGGAADFVSAVPDSPIGAAALRAIAAQGVDIRGVQLLSGRLGIYFVERGDTSRPMRVVYDRDATAVRNLEPQRVDWHEVLRDARWLHLSGITPALSDSVSDTCRAAATAARDAGVPISIDLNWRPALWQGRDPVPVMRALVEHATVVIANVPAVHAMLDLATDSSDPHQVATAVQSRCGAAQVAITQRVTVSAVHHIWSAGLLSGGAFHRSAVRDVTVVDRVGGGDACAAALLFALAHGTPPASAIEFAAAAGALKLAVRGDWSTATADDVWYAVRALVPL